MPTEVTQPKRRLLLRHFKAPGDVLMLTSAVRDLMRAYPGEFAVGVRSSAPGLWENSPWLSRVPDSGKDVEVIECAYPVIHESNRVPMHFVGAFHAFLSERLGRPLKVTEFKADIHLSEAERAGRPAHLAGLNGMPYWIVAAGGKRDYTIKWWDYRRWQEVVNRLQGRVNFVQVGAAGHFHPKLEGALDLRGRTTLRELVWLVHHSAGVLTPVSLPMHLAAAVEPNADMLALGQESRPCVVVAGGREPPHWEAYPTHQFLHTVGMLTCCATGGCWRSRTRALGDGSVHDAERQLCVDIAEGLPRCMDMITVEDVVRRVEMFIAPKPSLPDAETATPLNLGISQTRTPASPSLTEEMVREAMEDAVWKITPYPEERFSGRGVVICAGGPVYAACAWVCVKMLRRAGCVLPVELWHRGETELPPSIQKLYEPLGVKCVDALRMRRRFPMRRLGGWELKSYAVLHSSFEEVLLLDSDNVPLIDPAELFSEPRYAKCGAILWPDLGRLTRQSAVWALCGIEPREEPEVESGQLLFHKKRCWRALSLAVWMNEQSDFFYQHVHGDKETFHLAFRRLGQKYATPATPPMLVKGTLYQHGFDGRVIFQHRNLAKWSPWGNNPPQQGFRLEATCLRYLRQLNRIPGWRDWLARHPAPEVEKRKSLPSPSSPRIVLRSPVNAYTGYGLHTCAVAHGLTARGIEVCLRPTIIEERFASIPNDIRKLIDREEDPAGLEVLLHPPNFVPLEGRRTLYFTMWETTRLPSEAVRNLNRAESILVPCQWNAQSFRESGVTKPIHVIPLGIKTDIFNYAPMRMDGPCVFGAGGRLSDSDPKRKRVDEAVQLFQEAFPTEADVELWVKVFSDCNVIQNGDPRIKYTERYMSEWELAEWFRGLTCFVSCSRGEGWGLMQHQALATGRPLISARYGGVAEFFTGEMGYEVAFEEVKAEGRFLGYGKWAKPDRDQIIDAMRQVYCNRAEARRRGKMAASRVKRLSWDASIDALEKFLRPLIGRCVDAPRVHQKRPRRSDPMALQKFCLE